MLDPLCPECLDSGPYPKAYTGINDIEPDISIAIFFLIEQLLPFAASSEVNKYKLSLVYP
jgi:hypothetical protein